MKIETHLPLLEEILESYRTTIGGVYEGYKHHVYRMIHFTLALRDCAPEEKKKIIIAGAFHDLGIWTNNTVDYLPPSAILARDYLHRTGHPAWSPEIELMIDMHHKLTAFRDESYPLVEVFRKGDLVDFSLGLVKCGISGEFIKEVKATFPNAGFHKFLVKLAMKWSLRHPLNPAPIFKW